jgi:glycosyltransferase involved in cell wall biosynthesis
MAVGRPVVATGAGGSGEYLRGDENCLLFEPGDASGLAAAIGRLASEPELRDRLRAAGFETAARFGERSFNDRIERVLAEEAASE